MSVVQMKKPNLERITGGGDGAARAILSRTPSPVPQSYINTLDGRDARALGRFGMRAASMALRQRSLPTLADALFATALSAAKEHGDVRDLMVALAVHFDVAVRLGVLPETLFREIAARLPEGEVAVVLREFGSRTDVTLEAFGWALIDTAAGPDFIPTEP